QAVQPDRKGRTIGDPGASQEHGVPDRVRRDARAEDVRAPCELEGGQRSRGQAGAYVTNGEAVAELEHRASLIATASRVEPAVIAAATEHAPSDLDGAGRQPEAHEPLRRSD